MRTEFFVHLRRTRHGYTILTQLDYLPQETQQGEERLPRTLDALHVHAIQMLRIGGRIYFRPHLGSKLFGKLQVILIRTPAAMG